MGLNFRRRIRIGKNAYVNLGKKGFSSISLGKKGATVNLSSKGMKTTLGIPGTGISYTSTGRPVIAVSSEVDYSIRQPIFPQKTFYCSWLFSPLAIFFLIGCFIKAFDSNFVNWNVIISSSIFVSLFVYAFYVTDVRRNDSNIEKYYKDYREYEMLKEKIRVEQHEKDMSDAIEIKNMALQKIMQMPESQRDIFLQYLNKMEIP